MSTQQQPPATQPRTGPRWVLWFVGVLFVLVGLGLLAWNFARSSDSETQAFEDPIEQVSIDVNGSVTVSAGDTTDVTVEREWFLFGDPTVDLTVEDGVLRVVSDCGSIQILCRTNVTATVPADAPIEVQTAAGSIDVIGTSGGVDLTTSAGSVDVDEITGDAVLRSSAGGISGRITDGDVDARTSAGSIDLTVLGDWQTLSAVTSAGSIDLTVPDDAYAVDTDTSAGSVDTNIRTDPDASRRIRAESSAGSIQIDRVDG